MLIGAEIRLDVGFNAAQAKLANLARGGLLGRASGGAYDEWQAGLARVGPQGTMLGMSRLARVRIRDMVTHGDSAFWAMRWEVADRHGVLVPALDADIKLTPAGEDATVLAVSAICRPPLAGLVAGLDPAVMHQVAQATMQAFTNHIATDIADPAAALDAGHRGGPATGPERTLSRFGRFRMFARLREVTLLCMSRGGAPGGCSPVTASATTASSTTAASYCSGARTATQKPPELLPLLPLLRTPVPWRHWPAGLAELDGLRRHR